MTDDCGEKGWPHLTWAPPGPGVGGQLRRVTRSRPKGRGQGWGGPEGQQEPFRASAGWVRRDQGAAGATQPLGTLSPALRKNPARQQQLRGQWTQPRPLSQPRRAEPRARSCYPGLGKLISCSGGKSHQGVWPSASAHLPYSYLTLGAFLGWGGGPGPFPKGWRHSRKHTENRCRLLSLWGKPNAMQSFVPFFFLTKINNSDLSCDQCGGSL